jgi:leucyl aminopeptidase
MTIRTLPLRSRTSGAVLAFFAPGERVESHALVSRLPAASRAVVRAALRARKFSGKAKEVRVIALPSATVPVVVLVGVGKRSELHRRRLDLCVRAGTMALKAERVRDAVLVLDDVVSGSARRDAVLERLAQQVVENVSLAKYAFRRYKSGSADRETPTLRSLTLLVEVKEVAAVKRGAQTGGIIADALTLCRDLANTPGREMTPKTLAAAAQQAGKSTGFRVSILGEAQMKRLGMGAILGVSSGSKEEAQFIIMEYAGGRKPVNAKAPLLFIGKGVTFDSGGINLKPSNGMAEMHLDMSGGAAVIAALSAIARLKLPVRVVGLVPAAENMPSGSSIRPGDILTTISGKTIEVENTDAEGRLLIADALGYAKRYKPSLVVDVATLTGGILHALGQWLAGVMGKQDDVVEKVRAAGVAAGDDLWTLPLWEEFEDQVQADFGDVDNSGKSRYGQPIVGAAFLAQFAGDLPWAHVDIASTMTPAEGQYLAKGATGTGVRMLVELARRAVPQKK